VKKQIQYHTSFFDQEYVMRRSVSFQGKKAALEYAAEKNDNPERYKRIRVDEETTIVTTKRIQ